MTERNEKRESSEEILGQARQENARMHAFRKMREQARRRSLNQIGQLIDHEVDVNEILEAVEAHASAFKREYL